MGDNLPISLVPLSRLLEWHRWTVIEDPSPPDKLPDKKDICVKQDDMTLYAEPRIPFLSYEHDFELSKFGPQPLQYRIVTAYTVTDYHDADDANMGAGHDNVIDREIQFQLDEIFNPWDIYTAVHKDTKRWVEFYLADGDLYSVELPCSREVEEGVYVPTLPVVRLGDWDEHCSFAERVLVDLDKDGVLEVGELLTP